MMQQYVVLYKYKKEFKEETFAPQEFAKFLEKKVGRGNITIIGFYIKSTQQSLFDNSPMMHIKKVDD
jgi:hypothetical protein